ncbi:MAG: SWIM zinc finger family protein [Spirochaetaceae bacterium]|jgi:hypothetical protein|nr:SWIM zinc finger family protein [Spirochaetaceae bacterium]
MSSIIDLREISPDHWQAKYQGNYGVYTIKITTDGKHRGPFSCSCPSGYYPCKHIAMVEAAIAERIAKNAGNRKKGKGPEMSVEDVLKKLTREELYDFMVRLAKNNPDLTNAVFLEFAEKIEDTSGNKYVSLIRRGLKNTAFDEDDYYYNNDDVISIDVLDEWAEKAEGFLKKKNPREAVLIAQAYIEEFAIWLRETVDDDFIDWIDETYQSRPFEILEKAAADSGSSKEKQVDIKELYDYCMAEVSKKKYAGLYMADSFNSLLMKLSAKVNPEAFIALQQSQLNEVQDKSSYEAEKILQRIVDFYNKCHQSKKAWQCVEENIQIGSFRRRVVEKNIKQKKFTEAKKLIHDYIDTKQGRYHSDTWDDYLLQIARSEKDIPAIRGISYSFIKDNFNEQYYGIYKSAFSADEWAEEFENLFRHYDSKKSFWADPAADLLAAEGLAERLMEHIGKKLSLEKMEGYYAFFAAAFPEKTLALFRKALDQYAANNTGRSHYEHIVNVFKKMKKIPGGDALTADMKAQYRIKYKNRRAMMEILGR